MLGTHLVYSFLSISKVCDTSGYSCSFSKRFINPGESGVDGMIWFIYENFFLWKVASEILLKAITAGSGRYYQSSASVRFPKQYSIRKMEDLGNGWRCQKLHNEILYSSWFVCCNFFIMHFSLCIKTIQCTISHKIFKSTYMKIWGMLTNALVFGIKNPL